MLNVFPVDVIRIFSPNVPNLHVLHRFSPQRVKPTNGCVFLVLLCTLVKWMVLPLPEAKVNPHSSHKLLVLSMDVVLADGYMAVSGGRRLLTRRSFKFLFRL